MAKAIRKPSDSVKKITDIYTANEVLSALQLVKSIDGILVEIADPNSTDLNARPLGITLTAAALGADVEVLSFGTIEDPTFSSFPLNAPLYLGLTGFLTALTPSLPGYKYNSLVAKYLGGNNVFINMDEPIEL